MSNWKLSWCVAYLNKFVRYHITHPPWFVLHKRQFEKISSERESFHSQHRQSKLTHHHKCSVSSILKSVAVRYFYHLSNVNEPLSVPHCLTCAAPRTVGIRSDSLSSPGRIEAILEHPSTANNLTESCSSEARLLKSWTRSAFTNSSSTHFANSWNGAIHIELSSNILL